MRKFIKLYFGSSSAEVLNWDVHETSMGPSFGTSLGPNHRTFKGHPRDVSQIISSNSTFKYIESTLNVRR